MSQPIAPTQNASIDSMVIYLQAGREKEAAAEIADVKDQFGHKKDAADRLRESMGELESQIESLEGAATKKTFWFFGARKKRKANEALARTVVERESAQIELAEAKKTRERLLEQLSETYQNLSEQLTLTERALDPGEEG